MVCLIAMRNHISDIYILSKLWRTQIGELMIGSSSMDVFALFLMSINLYLVVKMSDKWFVLFIQRKIGTEWPKQMAKIEPTRNTFDGNDKNKSYDVN